MASWVPQVILACTQLSALTERPACCPAAHARRRKSGYGGYGPPAGWKRGGRVIVLREGQVRWCRALGAVSSNGTQLHAAALGCLLTLRPLLSSAARAQAASDSETYLRLEDGSREEQRRHGPAVLGQLTCAQPFHRPAIKMLKARQHRGRASSSSSSSGGGGGGGGGSPAVDLGPLGRKGQLGAGAEVRSAGPHSHHLLHP